jgi:hypothetical protein
VNQPKAIQPIVDMSLYKAATMQNQGYLFRAGVWEPSLTGELDSENTLVLAFGSADYKQCREIWQQIIATFPQSKLIGCSTAGEVHGSCIYDRSITLVACRFDRTQIQVVSASAGSLGESRKAGHELARQLPLENLKAVLVISDGQFVNGSELLRGLYSVLPDGVQISGGLAADGTKFGPTWVLTQEGPQSGKVTAVAFYGDSIQFSAASQCGWDHFGVERFVTRSQGSTIWELDGKPALQLYKKYLGERASDLPAAALFFPLELRRNSCDPPVLRTILNIDENDQSMTFAGDMPENAIVRLTHANPDKIVSCAAKASELAAQNVIASSNSLLITISCVGRRLVLKDRTEEEVEATLSPLPTGVRQIGFYSYGEIAPIEGRSVSDLHNQTMTVTLMNER